MSRKFIASILAASLALTSFTAAPARADGDDLVKFLAGATALVIIGNALDNDKRHKVREQTYAPGYRYRPDHPSTDRRRDWGKDAGRRGKPHHNGSRNDRYTRERTLPAGCLTHVRSRHGSQQVFGQRCLREHFTYARNLPGECRIRPRGENAPRRAYSADCLFARGYHAGRK